MGTLKKYRFKLAWQNYQVGDVIEPPGMLRSWLVSNGYVEPVADTPPVPPEPLPALHESPAADQSRKRKRVYQ